MMRSIFPGMVALALAVTSQLNLSAIALGEQTPANWGKFEEPSERAFTIATPPGWQFEGGIDHVGDQPVVPWAHGASPDGQTQFFCGDSKLPKFFLPGFVPGSEGTLQNGPNGQRIISRYKSGREFAVEYGPRELPAGAQNVQLLDSQDEPEIAARSHTGPGVTVTSGSALFGYTLRGEPRVSCVEAQTMCTLMSGLRGQTGVWVPFDVFGVNTTAKNQDSIRQLAYQIRFSFKFDPQWTAAQMQAQRDVGQHAMTALQDQHQQFNQWMQNQNAQFNATASANRQNMNSYFSAQQSRIDAHQAAQDQWHANFMNNFHNDMAAKDWNNYQRVLQIQDKHLEYSPELQHTVEVPNSY